LMMTECMRTQLDLRAEASAFHLFFVADMGILSNVVLALIAGIVWVACLVVFPVVLILTVLVLMLVGLLMWPVVTITHHRRRLMWPVLTLVHHLLGPLAFSVKLMLVPSYVRWWVSCLDQSIRTQLESVG